ncbi:anaerobic sulfatase maturase [Methylomonas sp. AM2-LC]|uniref:anaerobic sulfatase maturase n=1 Tax=Methylomonas sp. AM2-LC TaxID=3153301 RepID=UPI003267927F
MAKPVGPICNLDCNYCFYLEKEQLFPTGQRFLMSEEVLRSYIKQNISSENSSEVLFTWQGGEPMLRGLAFYQQAVMIQQEFAKGKTIRNSLQTNGVLLNKEWCQFLAAEKFMVGISLDGPRDLHNAHRVNKQGKPTFDAVMQGIEYLKNYQIEFNVLVTVTRELCKHPIRVYDFFKQHDLFHLQFNPVVERVVPLDTENLGLSFAIPDTESLLPVTEQSVEPAAYGDFLVAIFNEWIKQDVGKVYVMNFEWALASWLKLPANVCLFSENCGKALIVEHNGDVYSCDHYMYPDYRLGNLQNNDIAALADSAQQIRFGKTKSATLPRDCKQCEFLFACHGECPKNRFKQTLQGEPGLNYLCPSYKKYFKHINRYMQAMAKLIYYKQPASLIMQALKGPLPISLSIADTTTI